MAKIKETVEGETKVLISASTTGVKKKIKKKKDKNQKKIIEKQIQNTTNLEEQSKKIKKKKDKNPKIIEKQIENSTDSEKQTKKLKKKKEKNQKMEVDKQSENSTDSVESKKKKKKTKKSTANTANQEETKEDDPTEDVLTLDIVKELGGTEEDLKLVENIKGNKDEEDINKETETELKSLIKSLKFGKFKPESFIVKDEEEVEDKKDKKEKSKKEVTTNTNLEDLQDSSVSSSTGDTVKEEEIKEELTDDDEPSLLPHLASKSGFHFLKEVPNRTYRIVKTEGTKWYDVGSDLDPVTPGQIQSNKYWVPKLEKFAKTIWDLEIENYKKDYKKVGFKSGSRSEREWIETVLKSGTLNDKMSAYVILIQESPIHNLHILDTLISLVSLKSRRPCLMAINTLQQMFLTVLLVPSRKLRTFDRNQFSLLTELSGGNKETRDKYLITWMFEDRLKKAYVKFLDALEQIGRDTLDKTKITAITTVFELLSGNPEQESVLLERLVNKLGDPTRSVASKTMYHLTMLIEKHPAMKMVVVGEVERLLYRQNIAVKAQYYGICFLSQILLEKHNTDNLAAKLIGIYFSFFKVSVKSGEVDTKLMKALLTGVNRAFPYASIAPAELDLHMETMHKLVHLVSFNTSIQALTLLYQVMDSRESVTDRFYTALYKKITDPALTTSSKQVMFLNLLFKSMKSDPSLPRVKSFIKRLLQVCEYQPPNMVCGLLFLTSELLRARTDLSSIQNVIQDVNTAGGDVADKFDDDSDEEHYDDVKEEEDEEDKSEEVTSKSITPGWTFKSTTDTHVTKTTYDPMGRNPLYSGAEKSTMWELECLEHHFHPSVALFAKNLLDDVVIKYSGDPLSDFTLTRFLDRFVFRNPKKNPEKNKPTTVLGKRNIYRPSGIKAVAPDSKDFRNRDAENVPEDEFFMYKYFTEKLERKGENDDDDDKASVTSEEFNDFLDTMGGRSKDFEFDDEDVDFAGGVGEDVNERKRKSEESDDDEDAAEDDNDELEDGSDVEPSGLDGEEDDDDFKDLSSGDEEGDELFDDGDDEFDEEGFGSDNDDEEVVSQIKIKPTKLKKKFAKFDPNDLGSILADAEEFSHLLDENEDGGLTESVSNSDKASKKQLAWESKGDGKGQQWKSKKKIGGPSKSFKNKLPSKPFKKMKKK